MAHGILPSSEAWRLQNMASVEDEAIRHMDQSAIKEGASMLPLRDDDNVERPRWLSGCSGKDPSPAVARHVKFCGCEPLSECLHSVHHYIPAMEVSPSSSLPSCVAIPFSALRGVPQQHFYQGIPTTGVSGDAANRTSSGSSGATSSQEPSQPLFMPLQYPKGTLHDIYTSGSCNNNAGDARSHIFQELSQYDFLQNAKLKADIVFHPLYDQLLAAHVACLRVATPVDNLQTLEAQIANRRNLAAKYAMVARNAPLAAQEKRELDHFMASYLLLLQSFKDQLQEHVRMHAMEAVAVCWEIEQAFINLTGVSAGEGSGATMSDDENEDEDTGFPFFDPMVLDGHDSFGYGPLIPTETERSLMERVRQELKLELKQGFRTRIADVREEILRKRRAGKLPGETTSALKTWWKAHSKWPYPTEDEKARLVQETGLELKQINNWFINQRKRNWHSAPNSSFGKPKSDASTDGQPSHISLSLGPDQSLPPTDQHLPQEANSSWASQRLPGR